MEIPECLKKYTTKPSDCPKYDENNPDYRCSVDYDKSKYRINKALQESKNKTVPPSTICGYINEFLSLMGINSQAVMINGLDILMTINYEHIKRLYKLNEQSDIIWLRFTKDGYCGTIGSSNDINYSYDTNSGKIIKAINKEWNNFIIIIVPIPGIKNRKQRLLIEHMIGYYLSDNIPSEDMVAVQAERYTIHDEYTKSNIQKLQEKYGRKYSYDIYKDVEADVNMELHEKPFSILMRLEKNKQRNTDHNHTKYRNHEQER